MRRSVVFALVSCVLLLVAPVAAEDCRYSADRNETVQANGLHSLLVEAEAGFLIVEGEPGLDRVEIRGRACASDREDLAEIQLRVDRRGDRLEVIVDIPDNRGGWGDSHASLDLTLKVPSELELKIRDGSGDIEMRGVGPVDLDDGSGEIRIDKAAGSVTIEDGSGEIRIQGAAADVQIQDGSGDIDLYDLRGSVRVEDGSGEIEIRGVAHDVDIRDDGSGEIRVSDVGGSVEVGSDGSGSIEVEDVQGDFTVRRDGSGSIHHRNVQGRVSYPRDDR